MGDGAECRNDENVYFRMAEKSEEMLIQYGVTASNRVEEGGVEITVG